MKDLLKGWVFLIFGFLGIVASLFLVKFESVFLKGIGVFGLIAVLTMGVHQAVYYAILKAKEDGVIK